MEGAQIFVATNPQITSGIAHTASREDSQRRQNHPLKDPENLNRMHSMQERTEANSAVGNL